MSELVDKQVNVQKESLKKTSGIHAKLPQAHEKCVMKMKERNKQTNKEKNDGCLKYFLMEEGVYKARAKNLCHGYQMTLGQRFFIH